MFFSALMPLDFHDADALIADADVADERALCAAAATKMKSLPLRCLPRFAARFRRYASMRLLLYFHGGLLMPLRPAVASCLSTRCWPLIDAAVTR